MYLAHARLISTLRTISRLIRPPNRVLQQTPTLAGGPIAMRYLSLKRSQLILAWCAISCLLLFAIPSIDLAVSRYFYQRGGFDSQSWFQTLMHGSMAWFLGVSMIGVVGVYAYNRLTKSSLWGIDGRRVIYLFLVLIIGAGLIVNLVLKDNFGRARPRDIAEFGGVQPFSPPFVVADNCSKNCSFASGEGAGGFFALALAAALSRRRAALALALAFGTLVSVGRIASGAHFLSDTVASFFVMLILTDALYYFVVMTGVQRAKFRMRAYSSAPV
jgi:lipid A 4'-phosphatase